MLVFGFGFLPSLCYVSGPGNSCVDSSSLRRPVLGIGVEAPSSKVQEGTGWNPLMHARGFPARNGNPFFDAKFPPQSAPLADHFGFPPLFFLFFSSRLFFVLSFIGGARLFVT